MKSRPDQQPSPEELSPQGSIAKALGAIPSGLFVLTASHEDRRTGMLASWVQQTCFNPPMVSVSIAKGRSILPLISESRHFGLCQLPATDRIIQRKFAGSTPYGEDPFLGFEMRHHTRTGVPILTGCLAFFECQVTCHMDVEGDHDLFVGAIIAGDYFGGEPMVRLRDNGMVY